MSTSRHISILRWFQRALGFVAWHRPSRSVRNKLRIIRDAAKHEYPTGDMPEVLADIEAGRTVADRHLEK